MKITIILGLIVVILILGFIILKPGQEAEKKEKLIPEVISLEEKKLIEAWIIENDLNQYGDPKETIYIGGTPLFDERTGKSIDKYEYILRQHPDRPWLRK